MSIPSISSVGNVMPQSMIIISPFALKDRHIFSDLVESAEKIHLDRRLFTALAAF